MSGVLSVPIASHARPGDVLAWVDGRPVAAGTFVADVRRLAARLAGHERARRYVVNACADRYRFAATLCASAVAGRVSLLPSSRAPAVLAELAARYPDHIVAADADLGGGFSLRLAVDEIPGVETAWPPPLIARDAQAAIAFTSGSTGVPLPQVKLWGSLVDGAFGERTGLGLEGPADTVVVGTVSPQHMFGLESTVMLPLCGPFAFSNAHPLHPEQVAADLATVRGHRVLVTTPVHLRALAASGVELPPLACIVCATAPLTEELAARCEALWHTRVLEIYGCTETGQVAARRTVDGPWWQALQGVTLEERDDGFWAGGGHITAPAPLADRLRLRDARTFLLEGRNSDLVNVAGKRTSLAALNHALLAVDGVLDGTFFVPDAVQNGGREARLLAFVVAPQRTRTQILAALRSRMDPVFLPRPLVLVDALPRNSTGKLPHAELRALARDHVERRA
ncbi:MAG TPA: AMP-binding protein [Burkholderiaceae bacterium]|nr:AMP-binding protein [Burkholderiaceae bacterium]